VQKFSSDGTHLTMWGHFGPGDGEFDLTNSITVDDAGVVFVMDCHNHRVQLFKYLPTAIEPRSWSRIKSSYRSASDGSR
jgi:hypothetical protein